MGNFDCAGVSSGMDRRAFLKLSGLTAGIAALSGTMLAGCSSKEGGENVDDKVGGEASAGIPFSVYESDIVLIGAGFGATFAINEARKAGKSITVLEKAPFGFGGSAGMNFNIMHTWKPDTWYETEDEVPVKLEFQEAYIRDLNLWAKTYVQNEIEVNPEVVCANFGEVHQDRNPDGTPFYIYDFPTTRGFEYSMTRNWCDFIDSKDFVTVHDRTMAVDLIVEDGRCLGIVGLHLPTGEYRVYRAKAVISATGGCCQFFGWHGTSCTSINVPDNTAEVEMSILRHGGRIADSEFASYDTMTIYPASFAATVGGGMGADSVHSHDLVDKNGKHLDEYEEIVANGWLKTQEGVIKAVNFANEMGNGTENGGVYLKCTAESLPTMRYMYTRNADYMKKEYGFDFTEQLVEVVPEMYEHGGQPLVDQNAMCRDFEGLFMVRANSGSQGGNQNSLNRLMGRYAMKKALEYVDAYKEPADATFASVIEEIARLEDLRTRKIEGSIRPITVRRAIQMACAEAARPARPTAVLEAARDELERILAEDLPKMACADNSRMWNADWKDAIEVINLLDEARLLVAASLEREESRAAFIRPEFPETDNENWFCSLAYTRAADGTLTSEKITF